MSTTLSLFTGSHLANVLLQSTRTFTFFGRPLRALRVEVVDLMSSAFSGCADSSGTPQDRLLLDHLDPLRCTRGALVNLLLSFG